MLDESAASLTASGAKSKSATRGPGILYLVATPIGNLDDIGLRAIETLRTVDVIAAEDTRHATTLLARHGIGTPLVPLHEHNEERASENLLGRLLAGVSVAVISDAGTPLISDPGLPLVRKARAHGIRTVPIPGPCAAIAALSASGLAVDRFAFEGFPPRTTAQRRRLFDSLRHDPRTLIFYESSHRVRATVDDMACVFEPTRRLVLARELTKVFETIAETRLAEADRLFMDPNMSKGEFVLLIEGAADERPQQELAPAEEHMLRVLLTECSVKTASSLAARISGGRRETFYRRALEIAGGHDGPDPEPAPKPF